MFYSFVKHQLFYLMETIELFIKGLAMELMRQGAMLTVLSSLLMALAWPATILAATEFIDSKWTIAVNRFRTHGLSLMTMFPCSSLCYFKHLNVQSYIKTTESGINIE